MPRAGHVLLLSLVAARMPARAADVVDPFTEPDESELLRAEERVVTVASRTAQTVARASSIVHVVTASEIRERGYRSIADALNAIPGVYIAISEEGRRLAWVRGVISPDNNKVLLLVDGVPWYDGLYTHAWIDEYLPLHTVRQIEVIRGPASSSYGTNAFAAVINVVTYGPGDLKGGFVRGEVGSWSRRGFTGVFGDRLGEGDRAVGVRVYARTFETDGDGLDLLPDGTRDVGGDLPRRAVSGGLLLEHRGLSLRYDHVDYRHAPLIATQDDALDVLLQDIDGFAYRYADDFVAARWELPLGTWGRIVPEAFLQRHDDPGVYAWLGEDDEDESGLVEAEKLTARYGAAVRAELRPGLDHVTQLGVGAEANRLLKVEDGRFLDGATAALTDTFTAPRAALTDVYGFMQHQWAPAWWVEMTGGLRVDRRGFLCLQAEDSCTLPEGHLVWSPRFGVTLAPDNALGLKATYGRAFRSPNARELLVVVGQDEDDHNLATASNPSLAPEVIDTVEAELKATPWRPLTLRVGAFGSLLRDEIDRSTEVDETLGDAWYDNRTGSNIYGAEAEATLRVSTVEIGTSYSWVSAVDLETGRTQYGFPPHIGHGRLTWRPIQGLRASVMGDVVGPRPQAQWSPDAGLEDGEPYGLLHLALATDGLAGGRVRADLSVRNALDTAYTRPLYRDDVNAVTVQEIDGEKVTTPVYPYPLEGEERTVVVGVEVAF